MMILYAKPKIKKGKVENLKNNSLKDRNNTQKDENQKDNNLKDTQDSKIDNSKTDNSKTNSLKADNIQTNSLKTDSSKTDSSTDNVQTDNSKIDSSRTDSSRPDDLEKKEKPALETKIKFIPYLLSRIEEIKLEERSEDSEAIFNSIRRFISILQIINILSMIFDQNFMFNSGFDKNSLTLVQTQNTIKNFYSIMFPIGNNRNSQENYMKEFGLQFSDLLNFDQNILVVIDTKKEEGTIQEFDKIIESNMKNPVQNLVFSLNSNYRFDINSKEIGKDSKENFYFIATFLLTFFVNRQLLEIFLSSSNQNQKNTQDFLMKLVDNIISPLSNAPSFIKINETTAFLKYKQNKTLQFYKSDIQNILNEAAFMYKYIISNNIAEDFMKIEENAIDIDTCNREDVKNLGFTNLFFTKDKSKEEIEIILTIFFLLKKYKTNIFL